MRAGFIILSCLFLFLNGLAQEIERVTIEGGISAPVGDDVEGVTIYNKSSQKGAITDIDGNFLIEVAENDRVLITAMQYQTFTVIIDKGIVENKRMHIYLNPSVNRLDEVILRPYDLSGNVQADVGSIETSVFNPEWDLSFEALEFEYEFAPDAWSSVKGNKAEEAYYNGQRPFDGVSIIGIIGLFASKKTQLDVARENREKALVRGGLIQRFPKHYVVETFQIPEEEYGKFLYFAEDAGIPQSMLKEENTIELLDFLFLQSQAYKKQRDN